MPEATDRSEITLSERLWEFASCHQLEAKFADQRNRFELARYHEGKAFAYEHAARMLDGTDGS